MKKSNSCRKGRKALMYLLLSIGFIAGQPSFAMADDNVSEVKTVQQQTQVVGVVNDAMGPVIGASVLEKERLTVPLPISTVVLL